MEPGDKVRVLTGKHKGKTATFRWSEPSDGADQRGFQHGVILDGDEKSRQITYFGPGEIALADTSKWPLVIPALLSAAFAVISGIVIVLKTKRR